MRSRALFVTIILMGALISILAVTAAEAALSGANHANVKIDPGNLSLSYVGPPVAKLADTTLTGSPVTTFGSLGSFRVIDARGTRIGWHLHMMAPNFTHDTSAAIPPIPTAGKFIVTLAPYWNAGGTDIAAVTGNLGGAGYDIFDTGAGGPGGLGTNWVSPLVSLEIPADAYAGSYSTTVTSTLSSY